MDISVFLNRWLSSSFFILYSYRSCVLSFTLCFFLFSYLLLVSFFCSLFISFFYSLFIFFFYPIFVSFYSLFLFVIIFSIYLVLFIFNLSRFFPLYLFRYFIFYFSRLLFSICLVPLSSIYSPILCLSLSFLLVSFISHLPPISPLPD